MKKSQRQLAVTSTLFFLTLSGSGCPKPPKVEKPSVAPAALSSAPANEGTFVAGVFEKFMRLGTTRLIAEGAKPEMFVGRFDATGRTSWLKAYRTVSDHRAVAFFPGSDLLVVVGVFDDTLNIDGRELKANQNARPPAGKDTLFFVTFDRNGQVITAKPLASSALLASPEIGREDQNYRINIRTGGASDVPNVQVDGNGDQLSLLVAPDGTILRATRIPVEKGPPTPDMKKAPKGKRASLPTGATSGYMLAMQLLTQSNQVTCDYCMQNNDPWFNGGCGNCISNVMWQDMSCWSTKWDWKCMAQARVWCSIPAGERCICNHNTCSPGIAMQPICEEGAVNRPACVNLIGRRRENCYKSDWNQDCVNESKSSCTPQSPNPPGTCF